MKTNLFKTKHDAVAERPTSVPRVLADVVERAGSWMPTWFRRRNGAAPALPGGSQPVNQFGAWDGPHSGMELLTRTMMTGEAVLVSDLSQTAFHVPFRENLLKLGLRACLAMPLKVNGRAVGAAVLHADGADTLEQLRIASLLPDNGSDETPLVNGSADSGDSSRDQGSLPIADRPGYLRRVDALIADTTIDSTCLGMVVLDITDLAVINDALGHQVGDAVLRLVAARLQALLGGHDFICHLGGGTFAFTQPCQRGDVATAYLFRKHIDELFESPFEVAGQELRLTARSGFAQCPEDGNTGEDLLHHAQTALGHAKQAGENYLRHRPDMNTAASKQLSITNRLRTIAEEESFVLNYQPQVAVSDGSVIGVEALLRWPDNSIPPDVFIPILESIGLIDQVGHWVIDRALTECADLFASQPGDFRVAVNVSPLQLRRWSFADDVLELLQTHSGLANHLELEVTESMLMADPGRAKASLSRLRRAGVTVAIDDFGTGHSSLRVLTHLPLDILKIDRCFIRDVTTNRRSRLIVQTAITLAKSLGMKTVAEGVETSEQADLLQDLGCDVLQGYLILRPAPFADVAGWLAAKKAAPTPGSGHF